MAYFYLIISGILFGGVVFGGKVLSNMGASLFEIMLYPNLIAGLATLYLARHDFKKVFQIPWKISLLFVITMLAINLGEYAPIFLNIPVSLIVLIVYLQPLWTILIMHFFFHHKQTKLDWVLVFAMLAGMVILIDPFHDVQFSPLGLFLALIAGMGLSVWLILTKYYTQQGISPYGTFFAVNLYTVIPLTLTYFVFRAFTYNPSLEAMTLHFSPLLWGAFLVYSLIIYTLPNLLIYMNNKNVPATAIGMILLLEPVTGVFLDVTFLGVPLTWNILVGGLIILGANALLVWEKNARKKGIKGDAMPTH